MTPNLEEAVRSLRMADKDMAVFDYIKNAPGIALSSVCFHAQQAVEKSLKAVLYAHAIEFGRTHDLSHLSRLLSDADVAPPIPTGELQKLSPYAVVFRYDDTDIEIITREQAGQIAHDIRAWAGAVIDRQIAQSP